MAITNWSYSRQLSASCEEMSRAARGIRFPYRPRREGLPVERCPPRSRASTRLPRGGAISTGTLRRRPGRFSGRSLLGSSRRSRIRRAGKSRPVDWIRRVGALYSALVHRGRQLTEVGNGLRRPDEDEGQELDHDLRPKGRWQLYPSSCGLPGVKRSRSQFREPRRK
jgi:hypothetical protein